jgi:hypothetical protein
MGGPARVMSWATREIGPEAEMIRQFRFALGFLAQATRGNRRWASAWRCSLGCTLRVRMTRRVACCKFEWLEGSRVGNSGDLLGHALRVRAVCRDRPCATAVERAPRQTEGRSEHRLGPIGPMPPISPMGFQFETPPSKPERSSATLTNTATPTIPGTNKH